MLMMQFVNMQHGQLTISKLKLEDIKRKANYYVHVAATVLISLTIDSLRLVVHTQSNYCTVMLQQVHRALIIHTYCSLCYDSHVQVLKYCLRPSILVKLIPTVETWPS